MYRSILITGLPAYINTVWLYYSVLAMEDQQLKKAINAVKDRAMANYKTFEEFQTTGVDTLVNRLKHDNPNVQISVSTDEASLKKTLSGCLYIAACSYVKEVSLLNLPVLYRECKSKLDNTSIDAVNSVESATVDEDNMASIEYAICKNLAGHIPYTITSRLKEICYDTCMTLTANLKLGGFNFVCKGFNYVFTPGGVYTSNGKAVLPTGKEFMREQVTNALYPEEVIHYALSELDALL